MPSRSVVAVAVHLIVALVLLTVVRVHDGVLQSLVGLLQDFRHDIRHRRQNHGDSRRALDGRQPSAGQASQLHQALPLAEHGAHHGRELFAVARRTMSGRLVMLNGVGSRPG